MQRFVYLDPPLYICQVAIKISRMKKWKEYSKPERAMMITIGVLLLLILLTSNRIKDGVQRGFNHFFSAPAENIENNG